MFPQHLLVLLLMGVRGLLVGDMNLIKNYKNMKNYEGSK